jgi:hypothetical protein
MQLTDRMRRHIWLPDDGPQLRLVLQRPAGLWVRVCHLSSIARIVAGWETTAERSA